MLESLGKWIDYLVANPIIGIAVVVILVLFLIMVFTRLFKWAVIAFILLVVAIAVTYRVSQPKDIVKKVQEGIETVKEGMKKGEKEVKKLSREVEKGATEVKKAVKK